MIKHNHNPGNALGIGTKPIPLRLEFADEPRRGTQAMNGYRLQANDRFAGCVCEFMMDDKSSAIQPLVIKVGRRFTGEEVQIPMSRFHNQT